MILAWLLHRRTRQATGPSSFSRRKPVVVATAPAAPRPQPGRARSRRLRRRSARNKGRRRGRFAQRDGLTSAGRVHFAALGIACSAFALPNKRPSKLRAELKHEG
jgi:hypothetical protein